jgi:CMP-N,N'-diacetyllegionaminic acid synthase
MNEQKVNEGAARRVVGLIPARSGSKRVPHKNIRPLNGHPLLAYSVRSAIESGIFEDVICVTDDALYAEVARYYGAQVPVLRPADISGDLSPDIEWVTWILSYLESEGKLYDAFSILRPTSPLRNPVTIRKAWDTLQRSGADSIRAVEKCGQHPGKMWVIHGEIMQPLLPFKKDGTPWHSMQYAALPEIYVQNASLEIAWTRIVKETRSIAGNVISPLITPGHEGADVNSEFDWAYIEHLLSSGQAQLSDFKVKPWSTKQ